MQQLNDVVIREIAPHDNPFLASLIKNTLTEFGANRPGTVFTDPTTDALYELFRINGSIYYVALFENAIVGGAGIYPTDGLPANTGELVKMYLHPGVRGRGLGSMLIEKCLHFAGEAGYKNVYLETMPELKQAVKVYEKFGFSYLQGPMGNSGHFGCGLWMIKEL